MSFSNYNNAVIARAAALNGYNKSVYKNDDGTLNWSFETVHPTDEEMLNHMGTAQAEYDTQASDRTDNNGALNAPDEEE
jgi:hypothetical protein